MIDTILWKSVNITLALLTSYDNLNVQLLVIQIKVKTQIRSTY